jgi:hypothetical protein
MNNPAVWILIIGLGGLFYLMIFHTKLFIELMEADQRRRDRSTERIGKAAKGTASVVRWFLK